MSWILLTAAVLIAIGYAWRHVEERSGGFRRCAQRRNLRLCRPDPSDLDHRYAGSVILRLGHSRRIGLTLSGTHELGAWTAFLHTCDLGFGADRICVRRGIAASDVDAGVNAVCLPTAVAENEDNPLRTPMGYTAMTLVARPVGDTASGAVALRPTSHALFVQRPSAAQHPSARRLIDIASRYPADWVWEAGGSFLMVASEKAATGQEMAELLDAVADAARALHRSNDANPAPGPGSCRSPIRFTA